MSASASRSRSGGDSAAAGDAPRVGKITVQGESSSWKSRHVRVATMWEEFAVSDRGKKDAKLKRTWDQMTQGELCSEELYEHFATWLLFDYKHGKKKDQFLGPATVSNTVSIVINRVRNKWPSPAEALTEIFLKCLDPSSSSAQSRWLHKLKKKVDGICFDRSLEEGEELDHSAPPLYPLHVREMSAILEKSDHNEAAMRKYALVCANQSCGRSGELSQLWYENADIIAAGVPQARAPAPCARARLRLAHHVLPRAVQVRRLQAAVRAHA